MSKTLFFHLLVFYSLNALGADAKLPCLRNDGSVGVNGLDKFDCTLVAQAVNDPQIKESHQSKIHEKLAQKLAFKIERNMEEMAILDQYFDKQYDLKLTKTKEVKNECRLESISNPCKGNEVDAKKLNLLLSKLPKNGTTLIEKLRSKFLITRGVEEGALNSCPLVKPTGFYLLAAQFDNSAAASLINSFKSNKQTGSDLKDEYYNTFPQLKIIKNSSAAFKEKFEDYIAKHTDDKLPKDYLMDFFKQEENQTALATGLADSCNDLRNNIKQFLCDDLDNLAVTENTANELFLDDANFEENMEISNSFSCSYLNRQDELLDKKLNGNGIDVWFKNFSAKVVRPMPKKNIVAGRSIDTFCQHYLCKSDLAISANSCKNGGPISREDLREKLGCKAEKGSSESCDTNALKYLAFLESLERGKKEKAEFHQSYKMADGNFGKNIDIKDKPRYSEFLENFVGVEGTLLAEGRSITPVTVAEKVKEFEDKKIEVIPSANRETILANNENNKVFEIIKQQKQEQVLQQTAQSNQQVEQRFAVNENDEDEKRAVIANSLSKFSKSASAAARKEVVPTAGKVRDRSEEIRRMRSELENVMQGMKGRDSEKLATVADYNSALARPKTGEMDPYKSMSLEDRERLNSYRNSLNNWERRLREREFELNDRDVRSASRTAASSEMAAVAEKRFEPTNMPAGERFNEVTATGGGAGAGLKLTKGAGATSANSASNEGNQENAAVASDGVAVLSAESLATLEKSALSKLGLGARDSFMIKVRHQSKIYDVVVKSFMYEGKPMLVPILNNQNRDLSKIILESPLFSEYRRYQNQRQQELE